MKQRIACGLILIAAGGAGWFAAQLLTAHKYYDAACPICRESDAVLRVHAKSGDDEPRFRVYRDDNGQLIGTFDKNRHVPDCYCVRCRDTWKVGAVKPANHR
jgi:hypothetical protein